MQPQQQRGVDVAALGEQSPVPAPVRDRPARDVARPDHEIDALEERGDQARERLGLVGQVGVHLDERLPAPLEAPREPGPVGAAEAGLGACAAGRRCCRARRPASRPDRRCRRGCRRRPPARRPRAWPPGCDAGRGRCSPLRCTSAGRPGRARRQPRGPPWGHRCPPRPPIAPRARSTATAPARSPGSTRRWGWRAACPRTHRRTHRPGRRCWPPPRWR